ncbi:piggyBac transposable element-derived protein 4 [Helicoverpa armigera]|uniref:piggyBac transposable element-derived protein 4 n=1 Tax=Helicoverpa armigera TaxID=29058 RepID=UPI003083DCCC
MAQRSDVHIARWLEEDREEDFIDGPAGSDDDLDHLEEQLYSTTSEYGSGADDDTDMDDLDWETVFNAIEGPSSSFNLGLEGTKWMKDPVDERVQLQREINPKIVPGPKDFAKTRKTPSECFDLFFDESIIYMIAKFTNERIIKEQKKFARERDAKLTDEVEIYALLGILFLSGNLKTSRENFLQLFESRRGIGMEAIYLAMSSQRYRFLMKNLRFNDPATERITEDKMAPIRVLFQIVVNNFQKHFTPSHELNLGELLTPYKGRCVFRQHMPKKAVKYGIKMFALADCQYPYTYNLELYVGDNPGLYDVSNTKVDIVVRMTDPIQGEYRNVTMNNWFTSLMAGEALFDKKITIVGAVKPNNKEVPRVFRTIKDKALYSSHFGFCHVAALVQYICKPDKAILVMSTKHCQGYININSGDQLKPEILVYYNRTKNAVETIDKMCSKNDVTRNSRRWPLTILFRLLNIAAINALCVLTINRGQERSVRREFLTELALSMIKPLVQRRMYTDNIPKIIKQKMCELLNMPIPLDVELNIELNDKPSTCGRNGPRGRCHICRRAHMNKTTREVCVICTKFTCFEHSKYMCTNCFIRHTK